MNLGSKKLSFVIETIMDYSFSEINNADKALLFYCLAELDKGKILQDKFET